MIGLWSEGKEIPEHVRVLEVRLGVSLLGMDEIWELLWVSDEKDRGIVANHIPVTFFGIKFNRESSWVSLSVSRSLFSSDCRKSEETGGSLAHFSQKLSFGVLAHIVGDFKISVCSRSLGVDDSFWNSFSVEFGQFVDQMEVL